MDKTSPSFIGAAKGMIGDTVQSRCDVETKQNAAVSNGKRVIYVDASCVNGRYQIGMYDILKSEKTTLQLGKNVDSSAKAEKFAILYGLLYLFERNKKGVVLNDSKEAIRAIGSELPLYQSVIAWIPREINLADQVSRDKPKRSKKAWRRLKSVAAIIIPELLSTKPCPDLKNEKQVVMSPYAIKMTDFINEKKDFLPTTSISFARKIVSILKSMGKEVVKGDAKKIREEMIRAKIIMVKDNVIVRFAPD